MRRYQYLLLILLFIAGSAYAQSGGFGLSGGSSIGAPPTPPSAWQDFATSEWGTGETYDYVDELSVPPLILDQVIGPGIDTTGWTTSNPACTASAVRSAITTAEGLSTNGPDKRIIQLPNTCTLAWDNTTFAFSAAAHSIILRGGADGLTEFVREDTGVVGGEGFVRTMFSLAGASSITTWTWTAGYAEDSQVLTATGVDELYVGDIIAIEITSWTGASAVWKHGLTVIGAQWSDTTTVGDQTGITGINQIRVAYPIGIDATGSAMNETFTGQTVRHISRYDTDGDGGTLDDNIPYRVGIEDIKITNTDPGSIRHYNQGIHYTACFDCWFTGNFWNGGWSNRWYHFNSVNVSRVLVQGNDHLGQKMAVKNQAEITVLTTENPTLATIDVTNVVGDQLCENSGDGWAMHSRWDFGAVASAERAEMAGKLLTCTCTGHASAECGYGDNLIHVLLYDFATGNAIDGTGFNADPDDAYVHGVDDYNIAGGYVNSGANDVQIINNAFQNPRVAFICQGGGSNMVFAYNWIAHDPTVQASRGYFTHGSCRFPYIEGNDSDVGYVPVASGPSGGMGNTAQSFVYNRGRLRGSETHTRTDNCADGDFCIENYPQTHANQWNIFLGNFLQGVSYGSEPLCDDSNDTFDNCKLHKNIWWGGSVSTSVGSTADVTRPDINVGDNNPADSAADAGFGGVNWPSAPLFDDRASLPDWWCTQSGTDLPVIGAARDDHNGGSPTFNKLPAQIRYEAGTCTAL